MQFIFGAVNKSHNKLSPGIRKTFARLMNRQVNKSRNKLHNKLRKTNERQVNKSRNKSRNKSSNKLRKTFVRLMNRRIDGDKLLFLNSKCIIVWGNH